jgi:hypothetical protein
VEIPAPSRVRCAQHGTVAELIQTPNGQVRYTPQRLGQEATPPPARLLEDT